MAFQGPLIIGKQMADYFLANSPPVGTKITAAVIEDLWEGAMAFLYADMEDNMQVQPGTFVVAGVQAGSSTLPVTGLGGPAE